MLKRDTQKFRVTRTDHVVEFLWWNCTRGLTHTRYITVRDSLLCQQLSTFSIRVPILLKTKIHNILPRMWGVTIDGVCIGY
jgi:hypothetical protein